MEQPGQMGRSDHGWDHPGKQGPRLDHRGIPWGSKGPGEGDQHRREPTIGASRAHGEKRPKNESRTRRQTPLGALEWRNQGRWGEATQDGIIQGIRVQESIIKDCHGEAEAEG